MKFLHQGETIPVGMNHKIVKLMLTNKHAYYYDNGTLKTYLRNQVLITYENDAYSVRSFDVGTAKELNFIKGDNDILFYLKERLTTNQYFEFERFLFEKT
jgi:hypothetical protein